MVQVQMQISPTLIDLREIGHRNAATITKLIITKLIKAN